MLDTLAVYIFILFMFVFKVVCLLRKGEPLASKQEEISAHCLIRAESD